MARTSARAHKVTSYASDPYREFDSDDAAPPDADASGEEFQADDATAPGGESDPAVTDEAESESGEEYDEHSDSSAGGSRSRHRRRIHTARVETADLRSTPGSAPQVHRRHVRSIEGGKGPGRRRDRMIAEGASAAALRVPDPTVRITYKPGYSKASGKMDRMVQVYGSDEGDLKRAAVVRDRWISSSATPERSSFAVTPFWEGGEGVAGEDIGEGEQKVVIGFDAVKEGYLQQEGERVRCVLGRVGKWEKIVFRRFMIYDLRMIGEGKKGFMLNAGGHVLGLAWATNRPEGCQYLAVSTLTEGEPTGEKKEDDQEIPPAYDRRPSKSTIQIWRFPVDAATPSPVENPSIALLLCHDWGPARCLKWCPELQVFNDARVLGYLAAVFADGTARVLRVVTPETYDPSSPDADGCDFLKYTTAAYTFHLPDEVITSLSWVSSDSIVVGTANGSIAAFDLRTPEVPYLHTLAHHTYVTDITTCFPSFPNHIVTTSMDGYSRLASLLTSSDVLPNSRSRLAPLATAWVDAIQSAVSVEEGTWVKFYPFRRFFSSTIAAKHAGTVRSLSTSLFHPHLLSGGTDGEVLISNPSRRVFHGKIKSFQQTWFMWEWSEQTGLLRMVEGFKLEECEGKAKMKGEKQLLTSVYPKEAGITATAWNGNGAFAGWAGAAGAKGLVRVEDVAID